MVNGPADVFVERFGRLEKSDVKFRDSDHLLELSNQIRDVDGVHDVEVMTYLRMVQQNYDWGTN